MISEVLFIHVSGTTVWITTRMAEIQDGAGLAKNVRTVGKGNSKNIGLAKIQHVMVKQLYKSLAV